MNNPRVARLLEDRRVQAGLLRALRLRARVLERTERQVERLAHRLSLATARDVRDLKRTIRHLEEELRAAERRDASSQLEE